MKRLLFALAVCLFGALPLAYADDVDPADLAFWQSIQNSTNPAEYQAYLQAFPNGKFAALAKIRVTTPPVPAPTGGDNPPGPTPEPVVNNGDVGQGEKIVITPANLRVGQRGLITCTDFPDATTYDLLIVVPAGSPNIDPGTPAGAGVKVLWKDYASNCNKYQMEAGPFAPGKYELRFMTRLYNNDGRQEIATRTPFTVR